MSPTTTFPAYTLLADTDDCCYLGMSMGSGHSMPDNPGVDYTLYNPAVQTEYGGFCLAPTDSLQVFTPALAAPSLRSVRGNAVHAGDLVATDEHLGYLQEVIEHGVSVTLVFVNDVPSWEIAASDCVLAYCPGGHC